jgi:hypothetical protein
MDFTVAIAAFPNIKISIQYILHSTMPDSE